MIRDIKDPTISENEWEGAIKDLLIPTSLVRAYIRRNKKVFITGKNATSALVYVDKELGGITGTVIFIPDTDDEGVVDIFK